MSDELDQVEPEITGDETPVEQADKIGEEKEAKFNAKELQREIALLKSELKLQSDKHEYLARQHKADRPAPKVEEAELDIDLVEAVTNNDRKGLAKAIREVIRKEGYISQDDAQKLVESRASEYGEQQRILTEYPELKDSSSALFKAAQAELTKINDDPEYAKLSDGKRISMAAERAQLGLYRSGKASPESEDSRQARIRAQSGKVGGGSSKERPESEELTDVQRKMIKNMGITEDAYKKRAKAGVYMGGQPSGGLR